MSGYDFWLQLPASVGLGALLLALAIILIMIALDALRR
jgi:hypothetical protein